MIGWIRSLFRRRTRLTLGLPALAPRVEPSAEEIKHAAAMSLAAANAVLFDAEESAKFALAKRSASAWQTPTEHGARRREPLIVEAPPPDFQKAIADIEMLAHEEVAAKEREIAILKSTLSGYQKKLAEVDASNLRYASAVQDAHEILNRARVPMDERLNRLNRHTRRVLTLGERVRWLVQRNRRKADTPRRRA